MAHKIKLLKIIPQKNKVLQRSDLWLGHKKEKENEKEKEKKTLQWSHYLDRYQNK